MQYRSPMSCRLSSTILSTLLIRRYSKSWYQSSSNICPSRLRDKCCALLSNRHRPSRHANLPLPLLSWSGNTAMWRRQPELFLSVWQDRQPDLLAVNDPARGLSSVERKSSAVRQRLRRFRIAIQRLYLFDVARIGPRRHSTHDATQPQRKVIVLAPVWEIRTKP